MSTFSRLFGLASKAIDKTSSRSSGSGSGSGDWRSAIRSATDALTGDSRRDAAPVPERGRPSTTPPPAPGRGPAQPGAEDRAAIARYDYLIRTASPDEIEQIHRDAFSRLTPAQREHVESRMRSDLPPAEAPRSSSASDLARAAARSEARSPGRLRGLLSRVGGGGAAVGLGGAAVGVLGAVAGGAVLSAVAGPILEQAAGLGVDFESLAQGIDLEGIAGGAEGVLGDAGEQVSGWGDQIADLGIPGLGDLFGR